MRLVLLLRFSKSARAAGLTRYLEVRCHMRAINGCTIAEGGCSNSRKKDLNHHPVCAFGAATLPGQAVLSKLSAQRTTVKAAIALLSQEGSVIAFCDDARGGSPKRNVSECILSTGVNRNAGRSREPRCSGTLRKWREMHETHCGNAGPRIPKTAPLRRAARD